jgi:hypothetical protein
MNRSENGLRFTFHDRFAKTGSGQTRFWNTQKKNTAVWQVKSIGSMMSKKSSASSEDLEFMAQTMGGGGGNSLQSTEQGLVAQVRKCGFGPLFR